MPRPEDDIQTARASARPSLAARIAERNRQREIRAERLARLRPEVAADRRSATAAPAWTAANLPTGITGGATADADAGDALEEFLRVLTEGLLPDDPAPAPASAPGEIVHLPRPVLVAPPCDLETLPGAGPGLVWALRRAGIARLADLTDCTAEDLAARLGPAGRLVPAEAWIATARAASGRRETAPAS